MKNTLFIFSFFTLISAFSQTDQHLKSKLAYCNVEVTDLEDQVTRYKNLLDLQTKEVQSLKETILEKNAEIDLVKRENQKLIDIQKVLMTLKSCYGWVLKNIKMFFLEGLSLI